MEKKRGFKRHWQALALFLGQWQEAYSTDRHTSNECTNTCSAYGCSSNIHIHSQAMHTCEIYLRAFTVKAQQRIFVTLKVWQISHSLQLLFFFILLGSSHLPVTASTCPSFSSLQHVNRTLLQPFPTWNSSISWPWRTLCAPDPPSWQGFKGTVCVCMCVCEREGGCSGGMQEWAYRSKGVENSLSSH